MAELLAPKNIRVNCIAPGSIYVEGGFWDVLKQNNREMDDTVVVSIPLGRMGTPQEVSGPLGFIASPIAYCPSCSTGP